MRVFGGMRAFYYLQTLLTGDNETGRNPARFYTQRPLCVSEQIWETETLLINFK